MSALLGHILRMTKQTAQIFKAMTKFPIKKPTLADIIKLRMYEMKLNQVKLSELLGVSPSRISEYLSGKSEPTLKVARDLNRKLNIDANIILGV